MFTKTKTIESAFQHLRLFTLIIISGCFFLCGFVMYKSYKLAGVTQSKIYILSNGKVLEAIAGERKDNVPIEAKDHIKVFHQYFFSLDPDETLIQSNISKALYLADGSAKRQYENLKEAGYYSNIISGNISQQIVVDSVELNTTDYPYYFKCYATEQLIRATSTVTRNLITEGYIRSISRSDNNSHGFLIEKWSTIENKDIKLQTH